MTILIVVTATDVEGEGHGIAHPVPDGWLGDPSKAEALCFGAMQMFITHCRKEGIRLPLGADIAMTLQETP